MQQGISKISLIPVRAEPSEKSEMVTQILFGENFEILEKNPKWLKVKLDYDQYEGWISENMASAFTGAKTTKTLVTGKNNTAVITNHGNIRISPGSVLHDFDEKTNLFKLCGSQYQFEGETTNVNDNCTDITKPFLNTPYLWGGRSVWGIDCSGLVQIINKILGKKLPRDAQQQAEIGETVSFVNETIPGDLAFFDNEEREIIHAGIILENNKIIHAHGKVRIDRLDHQGIFDIENKTYSHKLRIIRRLTLPASQIS